MVRVRPGTWKNSCDHHTMQNKGKVPSGMQITMASPNNNNNNSKKKKKKDDPAEGKVVDGPRLAKAKSERKRSKEQERRNALNEGLDRLTELVFLVDPQLKAVAETRAAKNNRAPSNEQLLSRVELLNSAVSTFTHLYQENQRNKAALYHVMSGGRVMPVPVELGVYQSIVNNQSGKEGSNESASASPSLTANDASLVRPPPSAPVPPTFGGLAASPAGHPLLSHRVGQPPHAYLQNMGGEGGEKGPAPKSGIDVHEGRTSAGIQNNTMGSSGRVTSEEATIRSKRGSVEAKEDDEPTPKKRRKKRENTG